MTGSDGVNSALREAVARRVGDERFGLWFGEGVGLNVDGDTLEIGVPNGFFREWIRGHFAANLEEASRDVLGRSLRLAFRIDGDAEPQIGDVIPTTGTTPRVVPEAPKPPIPVEITPLPETRPRLSSATARPLRRLDEYVVGSSNRIAHAAALEAVQAPGLAFNPLVIHGGVGLGKTHLLEGIAAGIRAKHPGLAIVHATAEGFTNGFLDAMRTGSLNSFRSRFRKAAALVVDDIHFLAAKRATQDEFLHTFNAVVAGGGLVVLASDQHPRQVAKLSDELATRFLAGMVAKVEAPDPSTRKAILMTKAAARGVDVPDAVLSFVAENVRSSVRELEGALNSLIAHALLVGKRLDLGLAKTALRDTIRHTAQAVGLKDVERAVCDLFQIDADALKGEGRARALSHPRMLAMFLARKYTGAAYSEIGRFFGGRNHSTVIAAEKKVAGWLAEARRSNLLAGFESVADLLSALERSLGT